LSLVASAAAHALAAWQLSGVPRERRAPHDRDTFEVRMVALPPPPPPAPPPPPEPPTPLPPPPEPKPKPVAKAPERVPAAVDPAPPEPAPAEPASEPTSAPAALLADTSSGDTAGIVQLPGAPIGAVSSAAPPPAFEAPRAPVPPLRGAPLAKLSDLSRKPKAPPLDAALRDNYPAELRRRGKEGQAEVRVVIDPRGRVGAIAIVSESAVGFAEACRKTLLGSRWSEPLDREGRPVSTRLTYRCRFQIER
jgi:TonB family protein